MEHLSWALKYRPTKVVDCVLPDRIKKIFQNYVNDGQIPDLLLYGTSGVGKTTIAKAMCNEIGCDFLFIAASNETGIDTLRTKIQNYGSTISLSGGRKVIIMDEADYMNANSLQPALRTAMEELGKNCSFIFTCNHKNRIIKELHSRCASIEFKLQNGEKTQMASQFMDRIKYILVQENIPFDNQTIAALILKHFPDFRKTLNELQKYASQNGAVNEGVLKQLNNVELKELMAFLKDKEFNKVHKWVKTNSDNDPYTIYRQIYDGAANYLTPISVPQIILILAKYQYQAAFAADGEIQLIACLVEIMLECQFK